MLIQERIIDIIIPIYNAYEDLIQCVDSILNNDAGQPYRIILINDCSPDTRISPYLEKEALENDNVIFLSNETNLGFVKTVNRGMSYSTNDIVLLNSDTIVTKGWLSKILTCAYSSELIATVTPFTNNGTICSVPNFGEDNEIPEGFTIDSFAEMIEDISLKNYPHIPTAVGFCMFIKRAILDKVGLFDAESYSKGYGEENDFCCRVTEFGYVNVLDDATFIYHKGSMSFKSDKEGLIIRNSEVLRGKFPYYFDRVNSFLSSNSVFPLIENIKKQLTTYSRTPKKKILFLTHNTVDEDWLFKRGGTEYHVFDLIQEIEEIEFFTLTTSGTRVLLKKFNNKTSTNFNFFIENPIEAHTFYQEDYRKVLEEILKGFSIDLIHIHHLQRHTFDIFKLAEQFKIPLVYTVHDYHLVCPSILLMDNHGDYCYENITVDKCKQCLHNKMGYGTSFREQWHSEVEKNIKLLNLIIFPSKSASEYFEREYKISQLHIPYEVIEHGILINIVPENKVLDLENNITKRKVFNIAFVGNFAKHKGSQYISDVIRKKDKSITINWYLIGEIHDRVLEEFNGENVYKIGGYKRDNLSILLRELNIDLVCLLSVVPETFSYTLSESWAAGIPVLVNKRGALGSRVNHNETGWVLENLSSTSLLDNIKNIYSNPKLYDFVKNNIKTNEQITVHTSQMAQEYREVYKNLIDSSDKSLSISSEEKSTLNKTKHKSLTLINHTNEHLERELQLKDQQIQAIYNTIGWRFLNYLRKNNMVGKIGRKLLVNLLKIKNRR
ncbi:MAG: glycosyltransferase [Paenibacillus sp.]|nr:glycosyltransferase [Paenibacillus sp.]